MAEADLNPYLTRVDECQRYFYVIFPKFLLQTELTDDENIEFSTKVGETLVLKMELKGAVENLNNQVDEDDDDDDIRRREIVKNLYVCIREITTAISSALEEMALYRSTAAQLKGKRKSKKQGLRRRKEEEVRLLQEIVSDRLIERGHLEQQLELAMEGEEPMP